MMYHVKHWPLIASGNSPAPASNERIQLVLSSTSIMDFMFAFAFAASIILVTS